MDRTMNNQDQWIKQQAFIHRVAEVFEERDLDRLDRRLYYAMRDNDMQFDNTPTYRVAVEVAKDWGITP